MRTLRRMLLAIVVIGLGMGSLPGGLARAEGSYQLSGTVVGPDGPLSEDSAIDIEVNDETNDWVEWIQVDNGTFSIEVPAGTYDLTFRDQFDIYAVKHLSAVIVTDATDLGTVVLELIEFGSLAGTVRTEDDEPVPNAEVTATRLDTGQIWSEWSDTNGGWQFTSLPTGTWQVDIADSSGVYLPFSFASPVSVSAGTLTTLPSVTLSRLPRGNLAGTVTDTGGNPLDGIEVTITHLAGSQSYSAQTVDGGFHFEEIETGDYEVSLYDPDEIYQPKVLSGPATVVDRVTTTLDPVVLDRQPAATVRGVLSDGNGTPASGVGIRASDDGTGAITYTYAAEADGSFELRLAPGSYTISVEDGSETWQEETIASRIEVGDGQDLDLGAITLNRVPKGSLSGTVLGADGPLAGSLVMLYRERSGNREFWQSVTTDDGYYTFENLVATDSYTVSAVATGYFEGFLGGTAEIAEATMLTLAEGQTTVAPDLELSPIPTVKGVVMLGDPALPVAGVLVLGTSANGDTVTTYTEADGSFTLYLSLGAAVVTIQNGANEQPIAYQSVNEGAPLGTSSIDLGLLYLIPWTSLGDDALAEALGLASNTLIDSDYNASVTSAQVLQESALGFPRQGSSYLALATGPIRPLAGDPSTFYSGPAGGSGGVDGNDLSQIELTLKPPANARCLAFDFRFASEEYPDYVGSEYNDIFTADLNGTDWSLIDSQVIAPNNFAYDLSGDAVSVNTTGFSATSDVVFNGATPLLRATTPIEADPTSGQMDVTLSIQDLGDSGFDSIVLIDNMRWLYNLTDCTSGAEELTDTDGDGLSDRWETEGIDYDNDGIPELDLPALGADPNHKDIFLEIDWMVRPNTCIWMMCWGGRDFKPQQGAVNDVIAAFKNAPVSNPDGKTGINLHVDIDDQVPHVSSLGTMSNGNYNWSAFDAIREANFDVTRRDVYHYVLFADTYAGSGSSGISRSLPAQDFIVTDGHSSWGDGFTRTQERGTLMHELGHNLNLYHGGGPSGNYQQKAEYRSVMNYLYQLTGVDSQGKLDYSRSDATYNDWANLRFDGGSVGDLGDSAPPVAESESDSLTAQEAKDLNVYASDGDGSLSFVGPTVLVTDSGSQPLLFDVVNPGTTSQTYRVSVDGTAWGAGTITTSLEVAGNTTARAELPLSTAGLTPKSYAFTATLSTTAQTDLSTTSGSFTVPNLEDPAVKAAAAEALDELEGSDIDPAVLELVKEMTDDILPEVTAPVATQPPSITAPNRTVGAVLTASTGNWSQSGLTFSYQWLRDKEVIPDATSNTYTVVPADAGKSITVRVTATKAGAGSGTVLSSGITIAKLTSTTKITGPAKATAGKAVSFAVTVVVPGVPAPVGTVTLMDGSKAIKSVNLTAGAAKFSTALRAGTRTLKAVYGGQANIDQSSSAVFTSVVAKASTTTSLGGKAKATAGAKLNLSITIGGAGANSPTGKVAIYDGTRLIKTVALSPARRGAVTVPVTLTAGKRSLKAVYSGDSNLNKSTSKGIKVTVAKAKPKLTISGKRTGKAAKKLTYKIKITGTGSIRPTGKVTLLSGKKVLKRVKLTSKKNGIVSITVKLPAGKQRLKATYTGDGNVSKATSKSLVVRIGKAK